MNQNLQLSLANNAKDWLAPSQSISTSEKATFDALYNGFFAAYGPNFMARVYRSSIEQVLQNMPTVERDKLLVAFRQALDSAIRADLKSLRIIHGKGTGALRQVVDEMLRKDTRVREFRMAGWNEGGAGVTVAVFA